MGKAETVSPSMTVGAGPVWAGRCGCAMCGCMGADRDGAEDAWPRVLCSLSAPAKAGNMRVGDSQFPHQEDTACEPA